MDYQVSSKGRTQLSAKIPEELKDDFRQTCEENGETMTDVVEQLLAGYVADHGNAPVSNEHLPEDGRLRDGYQRLREMADPDTGRIDTDEALSTVAEATGIKKGAVHRTVIRPLDRRDLLEPKWGTIVVKEPGEPAQVEDDESDISDLTTNESKRETKLCDDCWSMYWGESCRCVELDTCDCGVVLAGGEDQCPNCRAVSEEVTA